MPAVLADKIIDFYLSLKPPAGLPAYVEVLFPHSQPEVKAIIKMFFSKYYGDNKKRRLIFGINPGRFGAGITGINFTAPKQLSGHCKISHPFGQSSELSAEFIYEMIEAYGGVKKFYQDVFLTSISPLGYVKHGKNINYYDDKELLKVIEPFAVHTIQQQLSFGFKKDCCLCIGEDKNFKFLSSLNERHQWFDNIIPLPHPRFIMQYRRKEKEKYIQQYISVLNQPGR